MSLFDTPRYQENPSYLLFEHFILDVLGCLPKDKAETLQQMNLQKVFGTEASEWKAVLREALGLSDTVEIAILDLWYRNRALAEREGLAYDPYDFAQQFTDEYMKEDSQVDVWPEGSLAAAQQRIRAAQGGSPPAER